MRMIYRLGELIESENERNTEGTYTLDDVRGISIQKNFIETKADMAGVSLSPYIIVRPGAFAYVPVTSRNGGKITIARNDTDNTYIVSASYIVFSVKRTDILLPEYLFMYFNRPEFDRYARFHSWGSAREAFSFEEMCNVKIPVPPIEIQRKYAGVYTAMTEHQRNLSRGLDDLRLVCDMYIEDLRRKIPCERIGDYIRAVNEKNIGNAVTLFQGVTVEHEFSEPTRIAEDTENGSIVRTGQFAFNKVMKSHNTKLPIALRDGPDCVVSNSYQVFEVVDKEKLLPEYLMLWLNRAETQRYAGFISIGTTRDIFSFADLCEIRIPIPDMKIQRSIANIYTAYQKRKSLSERLKALIKDACPVLIKGATDEAKQSAH